MYTYRLSKLDKNTYEILISLPKQDIASQYKKASAKLLQNLELPGFRKGKVPEKLGEKHLKKEDIFSEIIRTLIPEIYDDIIRKEGLKPVIQPKIELLKAKLGEDWQIKVRLAEKPTVSLKNYKEIIKKVKAGHQKSNIWVPGQKGTKEPTQQEKSAQKQAVLNLILDAILKNTECQISDQIIEEELNARLSSLLTDIQKIGLTVETYLKSKNLTQEQLRSNLRDEISNTYKLEFVLMEIAEKEEIKVESADLDKLFASITDPSEKAKAKSNSYFYASLLRKQKTLDYLLNL